MSYAHIMQMANNNNSSARAAAPPPPCTPAPVGQETIWDSLAARLDEMGKNFLGSQVQVINGCIDMTMACMKRVDELERQLAAYNSKLPCEGSKTDIGTIACRTDMLLSSSLQQNAVNDDLRKRLLALETRSDTWGLIEGKVVATDGRVTKLGDSIKGVVDTLEKRVFALERVTPSNRALGMDYDSFSARVVELERNVLELEKEADGNKIDLTSKVSLAYTNIAGLDRRVTELESEVEVCSFSITEVTVEVEKANQMLALPLPRGTTDPAVMEFITKHPNYVLFAPGPTGAAGLL